VALQEALNRSPGSLPAQLEQATLVESLRHPAIWMSWRSRCESRADPLARRSEETLAVRQRHGLGVPEVGAVFRAAAFHDDLVADFHRLARPALAHEPVRATHFHTPIADLASLFGPGSHKSTNRAGEIRSQLRKISQQVGNFPARGHRRKSLALGGGMRPAVTQECAMVGSPLWA